MTPDEFLALPPSVALRVLLEAAPGLVAKLEAIPVPKLPRKPKYDFAIYRSEGVQWASETDLEGLTFWRDLAQKSVDSGGKWAAKDAKRVKTLDAWIAWRRTEPTAQWLGERNDEQVTARPPSSHPKVHPRAQRSDSNGTSEPSGESAPAAGESAEDFNF